MEKERIKKEKEEQKRLEKEKKKREKEEKKRLEKESLNLIKLKEITMVGEKE